MPFNIQLTFRDIARIKVIMQESGDPAEVVIRQILECGLIEVESRMTMNKSYEEGEWPEYLSITHLRDSKNDPKKEGNQ